MTTFFARTPIAHDLVTAETFAVGLRDAEHTIPSGAFAGWQYGVIQGSNTAGYLAGVSSRSVGGDWNNLNLGWSSWYFNPTTRANQQIGIIDANHTRADGWRNSEIRGLNLARVVAGYSDRFDGASQETGRTAWLHDITSGQTTQLGLFDQQHTGPAGFAFNEPAMLNQSGEVIGTAKRFVGSDPFANESRWFRDPVNGSTQRLGFHDAEHTAADGSQYTSARFDVFRGDSGLVLGNSTRRVGYEHNSSTAWTFNPTTGVTTEWTGLTRAPFVSASGYRTTWINDVTISGFATGATRRFTGADEQAGVTNWLFDPSNAQYLQLGFLGPDYTVAGTGRQENSVSSLNEAGQSIGESIYKPADHFAYHAWFYDHSTGTTRSIGLTYDDVDPGSWRNHTRKLNTAGQAIGDGRRFVDGQVRGFVAWFYDDNSNTTTPLVFSESVYGDAFSRALDLLDDGTVLGTYRKYEGPLDLGDHLFLWSPTQGFTDIGNLVDGGLEANGWRQLRYSFALNDPSIITGQGIRLDGSDVGFALIPVVPEPALAAFFVTAAAYIVTRRSQK